MYLTGFRFHGCTSRKNLFPDETGIVTVTVEALLLMFPAAAVQFVDPRLVFCCSENPDAPEGQDRDRLVPFETIPVSGGEMTGIG